jgi:hypothetical protein
MEARDFVLPFIAPSLFSFKKNENGVASQKGLCRHMASLSPWGISFLVPSCTWF